MPKEDTGSCSAPLKRGNACLYCRKRRIRCSATKPSCEACDRVGRACEYDGKKPVSRVQQLEEKVVQLERLWKEALSNNEAGPSEPSIAQGGAATPSVPRSSLSSDPIDGLANDTQDGPFHSSAYALSNSETFDINLFGDNYQDVPTTARSGVNLDSGLFANFGGSIFGGMGTLPAPLQGQETQQPVLDQEVGSSTIDPMFMSLFDSFQPVSLFETLQSRPSSVASPINSATNTSSLNTASGSSVPANMGSRSSYLDPTEPAALSMQSRPLQGDVSTKFDSKRRSSIQTPGYVRSISDENKHTPEPSRPPAFVSNSSVVAEMAQAGSSVNDSMAALLKVAAESKPEQWSLGITDGTGIDVDQDSSALVGPLYNAQDLPKIAREHLLELFFSGMRLFGQEFHVPRFMASLLLPAPKRPHPCLLYSMYTTASRVSSSLQIRQLEPHFYAIACRQLNESIAQADRLLDATRSSTILSVYKYSKAKYHEGWLMAGQAARLAISCGLHQIQSSVWKPSGMSQPMADLAGLLRHPSYILPPARDAVEHGERIWAFWSIFITDRCGSISTNWAPAIADDTVTTPFPRPIQEYELGLVTEADDLSLSSINTPTSVPHPRPMRYDHTDLVELRLRAIATLERSSKLMYLTPEPGWDVELEGTGRGTAATQVPLSDLEDKRRGSSDRHHPCSGGSTKTAKVRNPRAYSEVKQALLRIEDDLPAQWRTNWLEWDGQVQEWHYNGARKDLITLHLVLGCAWMFLEDVYAFDTENTLAVNVAKRLTVTVRFLSNQVQNTDLDVFIAMMWNFISKTLIRELKRLEGLGDVAAAASVETDVETVVQALKDFGKRYTVGAMQALRAERYRQSTWKDVEFMHGVDQGSAVETVWAKDGEKVE